MYKNLAYMIESNTFYEFYLPPLLDMWYDIAIKVFESRMYIEHPLDRYVNEIRQWKSKWQ